EPLPAGRLRVTGALLRPQAHDVTGLVEQPDPDDVDLEAPPRDARQAVQHLAQIEGRGEQPAGFSENLQLAGALILLHRARMCIVSRLSDGLPTIAHPRPPTPIPSSWYGLADVCDHETRA